MKAHDLTSKQYWRLLAATDASYDFINALRINPNYNPELPPCILKLLDLNVGASVGDRR